jgi:hypothetical protein
LIVEHRDNAQIAAARDAAVTEEELAAIVANVAFNIPVNDLDTVAARHSLGAAFLTGGGGRCKNRDTRAFMGVKENTMNNVATAAPTVIDRFAACPSTPQTQRARRATKGRRITSARAVARS